MKKLLTVLGVFVLGVSTGRVFDGVTDTAEAGGREGEGAGVAGNGDVNGDGDLDV